MTNPTPAPPDSLGARGADFWNAVLAEFDLEQHDLALLEQAGRTLDRIDALDVVLAREGITSASSQGPKAHWALPEARQQRLVFIKLVSALGIPKPEDL